MDIFSCTSQQWVENEENFLKHLEDESVLNAIPLLNVNELHNLKNHRLVRFRGMIQDMHSPELYFEKFEVIDSNTKVKSIRNGKYCEDILTNETEDVVASSKSNIRSERHPYSVISIPGLNDWVKGIEEQQFKIANQAVSEIMNTTESNNPAINSANSKYSKDFILNFPLPNPNGKACLLKVYRNYNELKINDVCEFVGFLTLTEGTEDNSDEETLESDNFDLPISLVPKIHCVHFKKLEHNNPLLNINETIDNWNYLRKELLLVLKQLLLGDDLAAEYLIYHLISSVYRRREFMALGNFTLNISNVPVNKIQNYVEELYKFIEMLVPKSYYLPMTLENMNELSFVPQKDYDHNRLNSGLLQLSGNTHVILDETKLTSGKLNALGIENVKTLKEVAKDQQIHYKFNFYNLDFECDIPFLIISEGKSMVNSDIQVVLKPDSTCIETFPAILEAARHFLKPELLNKIRKYLTLARLLKYEITSEAEEMIETEFVEMRQAGVITGDDLHRMLVLSKLVCIAEGKTCLEEETWKKSCKLEKERKLRIGQ